MTSYEIIEQLKIVAEMKVSVNDETGEFTYTSEQIEAYEKSIFASREQKLNAIQDYKLTLNDSIVRFKEKKAMQDLNIKRTQKKQDYLKGLQIDLLGGDKLKTDEFNFYYTTCKKVNILDIDLIEDKYCKFEKVAILKDIKEAMELAIKNKESFFGAELLESKSLVVK
tara:strand:- start:415 stop:918 length:504 start_codon:yes stop_codon:yes gene_type:complete